MNVLVLFNLNYCLYLYSILNCCLCLYSFFLAQQFWTCIWYCFPLPASQVTGVFVPQLASSSASSMPVVLQLVVRMFSISISGIPSNNACPFPETTKILHILCLLSCSNFSVHMPNCVIVVWLYVFSLMFVFLVAANCSIVAWGNNFLYMYKCIIFPFYPCQPYVALWLWIYLMF